MAKSNRNHFNPNAHMYQQEACKRDAFEELMGNSAVFAAIAQNSKEAVKELRNLNRQFARFRSDIVPLCNNIIDYLELNDAGDEDDASDAGENQTTSQSEDGAGAEETVKCALCVDFDMNEIVRAAINATGEDEITVKRITKVIIAYLKSQMDGKTLMVKSFMAKMDAVLKKRAEGEAEDTDFDELIEQVKMNLPSIIAAVAEVTGIDRAVIDRVAHAETVAAKKRLIDTCRVSVGDEAARMLDEIKATAAAKSRDANGVEVR